MINESITIVLPLPSNILSPNARGFYLKKANAAKRMRRLAREAVIEAKIETSPWPMVKVEPVYFHKTERRRDQDNHIAMLKNVYDGIVDSGLVADDDWKHMERISPKFEIDKDFPRVELRITRIDETE